MVPTAAWVFWTEMAEMTSVGVTFKILIFIGLSQIRMA